MGALLDTSVFIAAEQGRPLGSIPDDASVSIITVAELMLGVRNARTPEVAAQRERTLMRVEATYDPWLVDRDVATAFASLAQANRQAGRSLKGFDALIAATALAHDLILHTQDERFVGVSGLEVVII